MGIITINTTREQAEDVFDLDMKELGNNPPSLGVPAPCPSDVTCSISFVCCCCSGQ